MRFQLPQFIETEVKLIGPLTLKQFLWLGFGGTLLLVLYILVKNIYIFAILGLPIVGFFTALAFYKKDGVPFPTYLMYILSYTLNPRKYTYTREQEEEENEYYQVPEQIEKEK